MFIDHLRFAWRLLIKQPAFAITAVLTLGLAIGANTAVFTIVDAVLMKPLPYWQPDRLALLSRQYRGAGTAGSDIGHGGAQWLAVHDQATSVDAAVLSGLAARVNLVRDTAAVSVVQQRVSTGYFGLLGVSPALGREFTADEDLVNGPAVVVLSHALWRSAFNSDPDVIGQSILLRGEPSTVVGVMPETFRNGQPVDLWTPLRPSATGEGRGQNYTILLRLRPGVTWPQAGAEMASIVDPTLRRRTTSDGLTVTHGVVPLQEGLTVQVRRPLLLLWAAVGLVLVVACVNLAGLLLARAGRRTREIATRLAIGGDRRTVMMQLLVENVLLASFGGGLGLLFGWLGLEAFEVLAADMLTNWSDLALDGRALIVTLVTTVLMAIVFGMTPAIQATRVDVQAALSEGGTRAVAGGTGGWRRRLLVIGEVALVVVLLVSAGLLIRTFTHLQNLSPGFDMANVMTASASLQDVRYTTHGPVMRLFDDSLARLRATPQVEAAAVALGLPYERILNMTFRLTSSPSADLPLTSVTYVTPGYFDATRIPIARGRVVTELDTDTSQRIAIVNREFVRRYVGDRDPLGEQIQMVGAGGALTIVGVVGNVQQRGGFNGYGPIDTLPNVYLPYAQMLDGSVLTFHTWFAPKWIVRGRGSMAGLESSIRSAIADADRQLPVVSVQGVDQARAASLALQRLLMTIVAALSATALLLAAIGIHGLIASAVSERLRELGIRMALGASVKQAMWTVMFPGVSLTIVGLAIGSVLALGASGLVRRLLWGVTPTDPLTFAGVAVMLLTVAVVASLIPALRVRRVDPATLLRE
jgi:predicted permease